MDPQEIQSSPDPVETLRAQGETFTANFPVVENEYTNWIEEQQAASETVSLADLSHHMTAMHLEGPDALELLRDYTTRAYDDFEVGTAKQIVMCNPRGHVIGDGTLLRLDDDAFYGPGIVGANWLVYNVENGDYDVSIETEPSTPSLPGDPESFVFQVQGPNAYEVLEELTDDPVRDIGFYHFDDVTLAGHDVRVVGHGMSTEPGVEIHGPFEEEDEVRDAILDAGEEYGIRRLGSKAYTTLSVGLGWVAPRIPPIYDVEKMAGFREWLDANSKEGSFSIGGSFIPEDVTDLYVTPLDLGYEKLVEFEYDFLGRDAVEAEIESPRRTLVTLEWDNEDTVDVYDSRFGGGENFKIMELPRIGWARCSYDEVLADGDRVGVSHSRAYDYDVRGVISLCSIDVDYSDPGTEVSLVWGEPDESPNPHVESHTQTRIDATVRPAPFSPDRRKGE